MAQGEDTDPFCWDGIAARTPAAVLPARTRRRGSWRALAGVLAAGGVAAAVAAGAGGGGFSAGPRSVLATVADVTTHVAGYRFSLGFEVSGAGHSSAISASGELNTQPLNGSLSVDVGGKRVSELLVPPYAYLQIPAPGGAWQRIALGPHGSAQAASGIDIGQTIAFLRSVGTVGSVGSETLDGVETTRYHAVIDVGRLASVLPLSPGSATAAGLSALSHVLGGPGLPLDVWVDARDRVRQITMSMSVNAGSAPLQFSLTMKLFDYGPQAIVAAPPGAVQYAGSAAPALAG